MRVWVIKASRAAKRSHEGGELSVETGVAGEGESRRKRRTAVESTGWARGVSFEPELRQVRNRPRLSAATRPPAPRPPPFSCDPALSLSFSPFALPLASARLPLSFSISSLPPADPADVSAYPRVRRRGIMEILNQFENQ